MANSVVSIVAAATALRLLVSVALFSSNGGPADYDDSLIGRALGPGILPAVGAAIVDPKQTWGHLREACFWLENSPSSWSDDGTGDTGFEAAPVGYSSVYTPGTRVVAPPLVVAFLGEPLVCPKSTVIHGMIRVLILLLADCVGAYCIYQVAKRTLNLEATGNEEEMERHTILSTMNDCDGEGKFNGELVIPDILRPERGWIIGLPSKTLPSGDRGAKDATKSTDDTAKDADTRTSLVEGSEGPLFALDQLPMLASLVYYCNPVSMLASALGSMRSLWDALLLLSFYYATMQPTTVSKEGIPVKIPSAAKAAMFLAAASYADTGYAMFVLPVLIWRGFCGSMHTAAKVGRARHHDWKTVLSLYIMYSGGLHYLASMLVGGEPDAYRKVMVQTMLPSVAFIQHDDSGSVPGPSMGLHW